MSITFTVAIELAFLTSMLIREGFHHDFRIEQVDTSCTAHAVLLTAPPPTPHQYSVRLWSVMALVRPSLSQEEQIKVFSSHYHSSLGIERSIIKAQSSREQIVGGELLMGTVPPLPRKSRMITSE